jgi:hypothetical protein
VQIAREHGGNDLLQHAIDFNGTPQTTPLGSAYEGAATADYRKKM